MVATEVRKLAHRSARAAAEIGNLIETSKQSIQQGREFVKDSDESLGEMRTESQETLEGLHQQSSENLEAILKAVIEFSEVMESIEGRFSRACKWYQPSEQSHHGHGSTDSRKCNDG